MFLTNAKAGMQFQYFDIQQYTDEKGRPKWIAWFYRTIEGIGDLNESAQ